MVFQITIPRRSNRCAKGDDPFVPSTSYYSLVEEGEKGELERRDYCEACWKGVDKDGRTYWKGRVPEKKERAKYADLSRDARALALLRDALKGESTQDEAFVLALYLQRQKKLLSRKVVKEQQLYEVAGTEEMIAVPVIKLSSLQVETVQKQIAEKMSEK